MTDTERIQRLEEVVGTLITWLYGNALNKVDIVALLLMLKKGDEVNATQDRIK